MAENGLRRAVLVAMGLLVAQPIWGATPHSYFRNPWGCVGLHDYPDGTRISPSYALVFPTGREARLLIGPERRPPSRDAVCTLSRGYLPITEVTCSEGGVTYRIEVFAAPMPTGAGGPLARFHYSGGSGNYITYVRCLMRNESGTTAPAAFEVELKAGETPIPAPVSRDGQEVVSIPEGEVLYATPGARFGRDLQPGEAAEVRTAISLQPARSADGVRAADLPAWRELTVRYWEDLLRSATRIDVPEAKPDETLKASLIYQLIGNDDGIPKAGEGFYDGLFLRDGAYQLLAYEMLGRTEEARRGIEAFRAYQTADGQFVSQAGEFDGNGQGPWALWMHYAFTRDRDWLAQVYPQMQRAAQWAEQQRTRHREGDIDGLLPRSPADGENLWTDLHQIVGYDVWNLRAVQCAAWAAEALGRDGDAAEYQRMFSDYRGAIMAAVRDTGTGRFPPAWQVGGTSWGNLELLHPTLLFPPGDPYVARTMDHQRYGRLGFLEDTIRWSPWLGPIIHPYMSTFVTQNDLIRGKRDRVVRDLYGYLLHTSSSHAFGEVVDADKKLAWNDTIPHLWATAQYIILLRNLLALEVGDELRLLPGVPPAWLLPGKQIRMEDAPTQFGPMSMWVDATTDGLRIRLLPPRRNPPARLFLCLPEELRVAGVSVPGGRVVPRGSGVWELPVDAREVRVRGRIAAGRSLLTSGAVASAYHASQQPPSLPIPLVRLPLAEAVPESAWHPVDLRAVATTDPSRAPFMALQTPGPGAYLFTGLTPGTVVVDGVPFSVIDPAANDGRGLVVLQGAETCAELPREVVIPVGRTAKRVFFLGGVGGWGAGDRGSDGRGLVARYIVELWDGSRQEVPLIDGLTIDDWAMPPSASEVSSVLEGPERWHLNVHGIDIGGARIERIRFVDQGTPTSPVLAAVTLME